jgi:O-antigen ligase
LTVCAIWVAFTRRRTVQNFFLTLAFNGLLLAVFGVAQRLLGNGKIFWFFESPSTAFFSSFIYKNHGGAYLNLALAITCGLAAWYYLRGLRRLEKSNPSGVLAFFATCIAVSVLTSYARGATLMMLVFLVGCVGAFIAHQLIVPSENRKPVVAFVLILIFGYFLKIGFDALQSREAWHRLKQGITNQDTSLGSRQLATKAALEMLSERPAIGIGAGSFRFLFPAYQINHPALLTYAGRHMYWEHAHNDIVQFPIEIGLVGVGILLLAGGYWIFVLTKSYFWQNPFSASAVFGSTLTVVYAWWDFPFQCPAILITWSAFWPAIALWTQFEEQNAKG